MITPTSNMTSPQQVDGGSDIFSCLSLELFTRGVEENKEAFLVEGVEGFEGCYCSMISMLEKQKDSRTARKVFWSVSVVECFEAWLPNMLLMSQLCPKGCEAAQNAWTGGWS